MFLKKLWISLSLSCLAFSILSAQNLGVFDQHLDIGNPFIKGKVSYDKNSQTFEITGSGNNIWFHKDQFQYLWKSIQGDFILRAEISFEGNGSNAHRKTGWMIRNSFNTDAAHVSATVHGDGLTSLQYRNEKGANMLEQQMKITNPQVIQLERNGDTYTFSAAKFGEPFTSTTITAHLKNEVFVGLFVCSHDSTSTTTVSFKNVRITKPAPADLEPYKKYLGSRLELLNVKTGTRKVLMTFDHSIQAPNWTPDGKTLIYNANGYLYQYDVKTGHITMLPTGNVINNNNDHVLTFNGTKLAISNHNKENMGGSSIYILPLDGKGKATQITHNNGASYAHGWSPDENYIAFTGDRNGQLDLYTINTKTGEEKQLTNFKTLDDGSEYSKDGKYIYFNSNRTGSMEIYRMNADGSQQTKLTNDDWNNWFPHISPDQKQLIFISFPKSVPSGDHPFYKHCVIRIMPIEGGTPKILAYIYGGQGTMNVPNWSPDGKYIAFITNSNQL
ncbi:TolB family protein [Zhouia sp. PK063]|uniref:TolB family protein n=1 Tax=Zhouia sp. PK063 TaxID=3373602 RepID=UPI00379D296F